MLLLLLLVAQLSYVQVVRATQLSKDPTNFRVTQRDFIRRRGQILTIDGVIIAESMPSNDQLKLQRVYPHGKLYAHITGFYSLLYNATGVEKFYNDQLLGNNNPNVSGIDALFGPDPTRNVRLTIDSIAQQAAARELRGRRGSVVVLDTRTGGIVAMYSNPTFDPNLISDHNDTHAKEAFDGLTADPTNPMRSRATGRRYPPGSTFKVVTTAIAFDAGIATPESTFPILHQLNLPLNGGTLSNFNNVSCGGQLKFAFQQSCNVVFGQLGLTLGETLASGGERFGLNHDAPPLDIAPKIDGSLGAIPGTFQRSQPLFARDAIGQADTQTTPLEMALVAESVATGGTMLVPHFLAQVEDPTHPNPSAPQASAKIWRSVMQPSTASALNALMQTVVQSGTGTEAQIPGIVVAGKTGTAQTGIAGKSPHAWFIGFAPAQAPRYAIAVMVENGGGFGDNATGGKVAAPIAREVLRALFAKRS